MRIGFVPAARLLSDVEPNGEGLIATGLLRALAARGHDIVAWCERSDVSIPRVDIREVSAGGLTTGLGRLGFAKRIAREAERERFDVLHLLFPFTSADGYTLAAGAPLVCGPVNLPWPGARRGGSLPVRASAAITDSIERRRHARTLRRAARILVVGRSARSALPSELHERCVEIPFGVDTARFGVAALPDAPVVLLCGGLQRKKGAEVLVRALPALLHRFPRARAIVAGPDPDGERARLDEIARSLGVSDAVEFAGVVAPADMPALYARASVLCQPSFGEPFGMTIVEAMATGRPVVGTAAGGIPDTVEDGKGGHLVPAGDAVSLAGALVDAVQHAPRMGAFNRERAERRFGLAMITERIEATYEAVLGGKERARVAS